MKQVGGGWVRITLNKRVETDYWEASWQKKQPSKNSRAWKRKIER